MTIDQAVSFALGESTTAPNRAAQDTSPLTKREFEIARLVADGMSNRAIADKLVISPRTVDGHVERILARARGHVPDTDRDVGDCSRRLSLRSIHHSTAAHPPRSAPRMHTPVHSARAQASAPSADPDAAPTK